VVAGLEDTGSRPIYVRLDDTAQGINLDPALISHLVLLDPNDPDAEVLLRGPIARVFPPQTFDIELPLLAGYTGAVVSKTPQALTIRARAFEAQVLQALRSLNLQFQAAGSVPLWPSTVRFWPPLPSRIRVDALVQFSGHEVLIEVSYTSQKDIGRRLQQIAGIANLTRMPVVWVLPPAADDWSLERSYGAVPVFPVAYVADRLNGLLDALREAAEWAGSGL